MRCAIVRLSDCNDYLLPARQFQDRRLPHIHENTLNVALSKVKANMLGVEPFTIHDFRRTARTHLAALGVESLRSVFIGKWTKFQI